MLQFELKMLPTHLNCQKCSLFIVFHYGIMNTSTAANVLNTQIERKYGSRCRHKIQQKK